MTNNDDLFEILKKAQLGDKTSMNLLSELVRQRLRTYVYRFTLSYDLTEDIVQDSILEMFKFLNKLEKADSFWSWLFKIATNNIRDHHEKEQRRKRISLGYVSFRKVLV